MSSTNYTSTFIAVAEDCPAMTGLVPPERAGAPTVAGLQHRLITTQPYALTSDDVLFEVFALRNAVPVDRRDAEREAFFARDQACLRSSPLGKSYGWGVHHDAQGRVALHAVDSPEYRALQEAPDVRHLRAMRSRRA